MHMSGLTTHATVPVAVQLEDAPACLLRTGRDLRSTRKASRNSRHRCSAAGVCRKASGVAERIEVKAEVGVLGVANDVGTERLRT